MLVATGGHAMSSTRREAAIASGPAWVAPNAVPGWQNVIMPKAMIMADVRALKAWFARELIEDIALDGLIPDLGRAMWEFHPRGRPPMPHK